MKRWIWLNKRKGLLKAAAYCKVKEAWIITLEEEEELTIDGVYIKIMPAWKWTGY